MAGNKNSGRKAEKPFRDALRMEISEAGAHPKALRQIARKLIEAAEEGKMDAIKEFADRIDGKVPQGIQGELNHSVDDPLGALLVEIAKAGSRLGGNDQP